MSRPPRPPRVTYQHTAAFPWQPRYTNEGCSNAWGREARAAARRTRTKLKLPCFQGRAHRDEGSPADRRRRRRASRRAHRHREATRRPSGQPRASIRANTRAMALPTYGAVPKQDVPQQINWRRRLRRERVSSLTSPRTCTFACHSECQSFTRCCSILLFALHLDD